MQIDAVQIPQCDALSSSSTRALLNFCTYDAHYALIERRTHEPWFDIG